MKHLFALKNFNVPIPTIYLFTIFSLCIPVSFAQENENDSLRARRELVESGHFREPFVPAEAGVAGTLANAMDIDPQQILAATLNGATSASATFSQLGVINPRRGNNFAVLSTGIAGTGAPEPGTDWGLTGSAGFDEVVLELTLNLPEGTDRITFDFNFLSSEYPDFTGSVFNDTFTATLTDAGGTRVIAFASVNSSHFFAASAGRAGGSGFDIFTDDPSGVDTVFGTGLPDAGLTDFLSVTEPLSVDGPVTLRFSIQDLGDGILDSAVIIDNVTVSNFEIIDPNPDFVSAGEVLTNPNLLAVGGQTRRGAAADGVTRLLLRSTPPGPGTVTFSLLNAQSPEDGGLALLGQSAMQDSVTAQVVLTPHGYRAFAVYRTPPDFNRGADANLSHRFFSFGANYLPGSGPPRESTLPFFLVRPPVVLVHGLWSGPGAWSFPLIDDSRFQVERANYSGTNAAYFDVNLEAPFQAIRSAVRSLREQNIAATQADLIGHSMGGILSRNWTSAANYYRNQNFNQGDIHKLMTMNTPHTGSPLANFLVDLRETFLIGPLVTSFMSAINHPIDHGAIDDLSTGSSAILSIAQTPVPAHALVGVGGSTALILAPEPLGSIYTIVHFFADESEILQGLQHDFIVGRNSQEGGMPNAATTVFTGLGSIHIFCTDSNAYSSRIVALLNTPVDSAVFDNFPAPATLPQPPEALLGRIRDEGTWFGSGLTITTPAPGTIISAGNTIQVAVDPMAGIQVDQVMLTGPGIAVIDDTAPFLFELVVPETAIGDFELNALGVNMTSEDYFQASPVSLLAATSATLQSVRIFPASPILFGIGSTRSIQVIGTYDDGLVRDIGHASTGTQFLIDDPTILSLSPDGYIVAEGEGITTLIAINEGLQDSISVTVFPACELSSAFFTRLPLWPENETVLSLLPFVGCQ